MRKTINIDFDSSTSVILGYDPNILGPASTKFAYSTHTHGTVAFNLTNVSASATSVSNGLTLALSVGAPGGTAGNVVYAGDNITLSTTGVSTTISATGLALASHDHGGSPSVTGIIGGTINSTGWSLSIPDFLVTAAASDHTHSQYAGTVSSSTSVLGSDIRMTLNTSGLRLGVPNYLTTAAQISHTHGTPTGYNITIGSSSNNLVLSVGNRLGTNTSTNTVTGSVLGMTGNTSGLTLGVPNFITTFTGGVNNLTLEGNTTGTLVAMSSGTITIAGGSNITLSQNGVNNAFTIIGAVGGTGFTSSSTAGSDIVATLNTSGLNMGIPQYLTTAMASNAGSNFVGLNSSIAGGSMTLNSSGITISIAENTATATAANAVSAGDWISLSSLGAVTTISVTGLQATSATSAITASALNTSQSSLFQHTSATSAITSLAMNTSERNNYFYSSNNTFANQTHSHGAVSLALTNISATASSASSGLTLSLSQGTVAGGIALGDGVATITNGTAIFSDANGISFGINGSTITASYGSDAFMLDAFSSLLQATSDNSLSLAVSQSATFFATSNSSLLQATSQNSLSLGVGYSTHTHGSLYTASVAGSDITNSSASNGLSLGIPQYAVTSHTHSNLYIALSASSAYQTSVLSNTFAITSHTHTGGSVYFVNPNGTSGSNITFGSSTSGSSTSIFATAGGATGGGGIALQGSGTAVQSTGTVQFVNTNGISFNLTGGSMQGSVVHGNVYFNDSNGVSFGSSTNGVSTTITASVNTVAAGISGVYVGTSGVTSGNVYIGVGSNITLTYTSNSINIYGEPNLGIKGIGNTATVPFTSGSVMLSGINLTVNTSSNTAGQYMQISAPAIGYLFFSNTNGHSWSSSVNGMSTSVYIIT